MSKKQSIWSEERHLVEGLKSQNREAYDWLYTQYSGALYALIRRLITDEEIANDALQDCFIKIWKQIEQYDSTKGKLYTWMFNLCRNHCIDVIRSKNFKNQKENQRLEEVSEVADNLNKTEMKTDHIGLKTVLGNLSEEQQIILNKLYFEGYTQDEAAKELAIPLGTLKTRVRSTILQLRKMLS